MAKTKFLYIIVGAGLAGASAVEGIREYDKKGAILVIGSEKHLPYDRPPLTKKLWFGKKKVEDIFVHDRNFYDQNGVILALGKHVISINTNQKTLTDSEGKEYAYETLLLATGGSPRHLPIPGGDLDGICYYRYLDDYLRTRQEAQQGKSAVVIGGGFIGSEIAAALSINKVAVTMIFPDNYLCSRVFPPSLGQAIQEHYLKREINIFNREKPVRIAKQGDKFITYTDSEKLIESDMVIAGIGIAPEKNLATSANLDFNNGIVVNEYLQTSNPDIYAAGDNALFPYQALKKQMRLEHWDNSIHQGKYAGRNMTGAGEPFTYIPYFFSDLFEFGYEAVGDTNAEFETFADWTKENDTGVIYYLNKGELKGIMLCNVWKKVDEARSLLSQGGKITAEELKGAIRKSPLAA
ncbi:MAG: NAD(P)/FAD-dependent oxidoreductase [Candidatus Margulisiibacteriota bacterium]|nr:MAG: hypothetical protein A2X43_09615 [Candidatus Margulisbacteria bacterium GWD2_39_127]OGI02855.1 MAG: hypothetical protein A2X42_02150 [Candidatus Margulisbacteria bacterium GWF2_38_17]OGI09636.1 MAG: hypothetical protein A2X41_04860 [Candidatus Margulisbacteria bacterium GWE2_39_32]PZM83038.1 MAG: NAD(P)/FAD-dependent oxidoreductase [Candidatus Margulisiibacteriota bacterium]HAR62200.1 pyridine nucleotide-disulfide oxidoreductase [Candidatus Margulisiibacteriota bacterium]